MSKALFIHIPKSAGTSISSSGICFPVSKIYMTDKFISLEDMSSYKPFMIMHKHIPYNYLDVSKIDQFDRSFAIVRNPWSRLVSLYHYADLISPQVIGTRWFQPNISFDEFLNRMNTFRMYSTYYWNHPYDQWGSQLDWVTKENKVRVDILRYENLQEDVNAYFDRNVDIAQRNIGSYKSNYTDYYTKEQREKVAEWFSMDIEKWGFTFESGATKNYWMKNAH